MTKTLGFVQGSGRIDIYNELAWEYRKSHPDSAITYSKKALEIINDLGMTSERAKSLNFLGIGYHYKGDNIKAFDYFHQSMDQSLKNNDSIQYAHSLNSLGRIYLSQGDIIKSYDYHFKALDIFTSFNNKEGMGYCYKSLSELYQTQNNHEKALEMSEKTLEIRLELGNIPGQISILIEMAGVYQSLGQFKRAFDYYLKAKTKAETIRDAINIANINLGISNLYFSDGKHAESLIFANKALDFAEDSKNLNLVSNIYMLLSRIHYARKKYREAEPYLKKVVVNSEKSSDNRLAYEAYFLLSKIHEYRSDINGAYEYYLKYYELKSAIDNAQVARSIQKLESRLEIEKKEKENELLLATRERDKALIKQQQVQNVALIAIILVVLGTAIALYLSGKKRKKINTELSIKNERIASQREEITAQNEEISETNQKLIVRNDELAELNNEKDTLMNIVAHDLKSPFNRIKGLGELLQLSGVNDEQKNYIKLLNDICQNGINLIRDILDVSAFEDDQIRTEIKKINANDLLVEKAKNFYTDAKSKHIELMIEGVENEVYVNSDKIYLSRILDNLISNAIKFSESSKKVILSTGYQDDCPYISVKDFGPGFAKEDMDHLFKKFTKLSAKPTAGESSNGLGLAIVKTLSDRLGAKIDLITEPETGSEFIVKFPHASQEDIS